MQTHSLGPLPFQVLFWLTHLVNTVHNISLGNNETPKSNISSEYICTLLFYECKICHHVNIYFKMFTLKQYFIWIHSIVTKMRLSVQNVCADIW